MPLKVAVGYASLTGPRERNEDFCGVVTPDGQELENKGILAALADGIGGHKGGREAAEYTVRGLLSDYFATPDTWSCRSATRTASAAASSTWAARSTRPRSRRSLAAAGRLPIRRASSGPRSRAAERTASSF